MLKKLNDKVFFYLQNFLRNISFFITPKIRGKIYKIFFKKVGKNFSVDDLVIIKYPSEIEIGNNVHLNHFTYIVGKGGLKIGNNVMIGARSSIVTTTHNFDNIDVPMIEQGISSRPILIEDNVWMGFNVVVLRGVVIKSGSIVAANSVVTKNIEKNMIVGGVPAKLIKERK